MDVLSTGPCPLAMATLDQLLLICILYSWTDLGVRKADAVVTTCTQKYKALEAFGSRKHVMCLANVNGATRVLVTPEMERDIVYTHNLQRMRVAPTATNMQRLVYDQKLAKVAEKSAMLCSSFDAMINEPDYPKTEIGQNEAYGQDIELLMTRWFTQRAMPSSLGAKYNIDQLQYLQAVNAETSRVGCGLANCPWALANASRVGCATPTCPHQGPTLKHFVCNYAIKMDTNYPPYKTGPSCMACKGSCSNSSLCDCQSRLCFNRGLLNVTSCSCKCQENWIGDNCETSFDIPLQDGAFCGHQPHNCIGENSACLWPSVGNNYSNCFCTNYVNIKDSYGECLHIGMSGGSLLVPLWPEFSLVYSASLLMSVIGLLGRIVC